MPRSVVGYRRIDKLIGQRIRLLRHASGISAEEMAQISGMEIGEYASCELGEARFSAAQLFEIARGLKVNLTDIYSVLGVVAD
jgi:transcriptional regulator with XRE-family HTH domain